MSAFTHRLLATLCLLIAPAVHAIDMTPVQVAPHTWYVLGKAGMASAANEGFMSNAGFVVTDEGVVVLDALGTPVLGEQLIAEIGKITDKPIRVVVVSHYHADHYYGLQAFKERGIEIWAHQAGQAILESDEAQARLQQRRADLFPFVDEKTVLTPADRWLDDGGAQFSLGGVTLRVIYVGPTHSPDDVVLQVVEDEVVFAGDLLFRGRVPFVGNANTREWLKALEHLLEIDAKVLVPGHGPVSKNPQADLVMTRDYLRFLRTELGKAVEEMKSFDEAYAGIDWSAWEKLPAFREANRLNAYNVFIQMEQSSLR
ncbi:MAG: MBL fold metallo-hydrolase [Pseudazoarcus pumilus]|nr:MBL fold metallo-hydrolase [Pseudazoarcus pumilus]